MTETPEARAVGDSVERSYFFIAHDDPTLNRHLDGVERDSSGRRSVLVEYQDSKVKAEAAGWMFRWIDVRHGPAYGLRWRKSIRFEMWVFVLGPILVSLIYHRNQQFAVSEHVYTQAQVLKAALACVGALLFQTAIHWLGDESDYRRGWDRVALRGGARVLSRGWLSAKEVRQAGFLSLLLAAFIGLFLIAASSAWMELCAITGGVAALEFLNRTYGLKYKGYAEVAALFFYGPLLALGATLSVTGSSSWPSLAVGFGSGAAALLSIHLKGFARMLEDARAGHRTWPVRAGFEASKTFAVFCFVAMMVPLVGLAVLGPHGGSILLLGLSVVVLIQGALLIEQVWGMKSPASGARFELYRKSLKLAWVYFLTWALGGLL